MSFAAFRKYQKPLLWFAIVFSVLVFATFSGFTDIEQMLARREIPPAGVFRLLPTGERVTVPIEEFARTRQTLAILKSMQSRERLEDTEVWAHIMHLADARAAGLRVSEADVAETTGQFARALLGGQPLTAQSYRTVWSSFRLPTARDFEAFIGELLLVQQWVAHRLDQAAIVNADEVFLRWRVDHERFDLEALVFPDTPVAEIAPPSDEELRAWWDELSEPERAARFNEPRSLRLVYAWMPLDGSGVPEELLDAVPEPEEVELLSRYSLVEPERFPGLPLTDEAVRAAVSRELRVIRNARDAYTAFQAGEARDAESFEAAMAAAGLTVQRPGELLTPEALASLPGIGSPLLQFWLGRTPGGGLHFGEPHGAQDQVHVVLVTEVQESRPLAFEEAGAAVAEAWRAAQVGRVARDWREEVRALAAALPEADEILAPLRAEGLARIEAELAEMIDGDEGPDGDGPGDERVAGMRRELVEQLERAELHPRLAPFEEQVRERVPLPAGVSVLSLHDVPRSYAMAPDPLDAPGSVERFVKSSPDVFRLAEGALGEPLRHAASASSVVVRVTARRFPGRDEMGNDPAGLDAARRALAMQRRSEIAMSLSPDAVALAHELQIPEDPAGT